MAIEGKTYVCRICGQEVEVTKAGMGTLVCCNQPMQIKEEKD
jgi:desulfoferrodoxin-like iron-binding protein